MDPQDLIALVAGMVYSTGECNPTEAVDEAMEIVKATKVAFHISLRESLKERMQGVVASKPETVDNSKPSA
jgi:hypothetical protein